jgi:P27 family predicted phage terminase small subunit
MTTGRRPRPTAIKELAGNPGKRPLNRREPKPQTRLPTAPAWLQGEARAEYYRAGRLLVRLRVMTDADRTALLAYAQMFGRWMEADEQVRRGGMIIKSPNGYPMQNPYASIADRARRECVKLAGEFGMTPSSRSRIQTTETGDGDAFDAFLAGAYSVTHEGVVDEET